MNTVTQEEGKNTHKKFSLSLSLVHKSRNGFEFVLYTVLYSYKITIEMMSNTL